MGLLQRIRDFGRPDAEKRIKAFRKLKRLTRGLVGRMTWTDFQKGSAKAKPFNPVQVAKCAANRARRAPMFEAMQNRAVAANQRKRYAPFLALETRCGRHAFEISNNGAHKP